MNISTLSHPKYRPDIDGLRAVAVLSVVAFHAFPAKLPGGFIGVDVFFIISGFLISSILFENLRRDSFNFLEFYRRRVARIFPALLTVLAACAALGALVLMADEYAQLGKHLAGGAGFISNFLLWGESGYFDSLADTKPLLHLWSLGVEEQYYFLWPALVWGAWRLRLNLLGTTLALGGISFLLNIAQIHTNPVAAFYAPQSRIWELLIGSALAYAAVFRTPELKQFSEKFGNLAAAAGALGLAIAFWLLTKDRLFPGWWALLPTLGAALLIAAGARAWINRVILSNPMLVWVGLISFPLYLWHWPLLAFARIINGSVPSASIRLGAVVLAVLLAWLTCTFIEKPLRFGKSSKLRTAGLLMAMALMVAFGLATYVGRGFPSRSLAKATVEFSNAQLDAQYQTPSFDAGRIDFKVLQGRELKRVLFIGDSLMSQYYSRIAKLYEDKAHLPYFSSVFVARPGCRPVPKGDLINKTNLRCDAYYEAVIALAKEPQYVRVVTSASWEVMFSGAVQAQNGARLSSDFKALGAAGKELFMISLAPHGAAFEPLRLARGFRLASLGLSANPRMDQWVLQSQLKSDENALLAMREFARRTGASLIDSGAILCPLGRCVTLAAGVPLHSDEYHLRASAAREWATFLDPLIEASVLVKAP